MTAPQPPYGQPPQGYQMPPPPRKRHTVRNVLLGAAGLTVLIVVLAAVASGSKTAPPAPSPPAPAATASAPPSPTAAAVAAPKRVLIRFTGSGIENSAPFNVGSGPLTVRYSYSCASFGQAGNFQADLLYGNQSSLSSDDQPVANDLAMSGAATTTVYPQDPGRDYYLSVNSECSWRIRVST